MKLAFSTLGCPEWTFAQILDAARAYGFDGIEFRGLLGEIDLPDAPEFAPAQIADTHRRLSEAGVGVSCLSSSVAVVGAVGTEVDRRASIAHARRYIELAKEIGAPCVRVFGGNVPATLERLAALDLAADSLREMGDYAVDRGVVVAVETHDAFIRSELLAELVRLARHPAVRVLWDIHHPYRIAGESIEHSMRYLHGLIAATHVKDSVLNTDGEGFTYVLTGRGDVPIPDALRALDCEGYTGYLTLEWEKRWIPALEPPEVAFPQYTEQMRAWLKETGA